MSKASAATRARGDLAVAVDNSSTEMVLQGLSTLVPPTAAAVPSSSSRAKGEAKSFKMQGSANS